MFPRSYFAPRYWPYRYWVEDGRGVGGSGHEADRPQTPGPTYDAGALSVVWRRRRR